MDLCDIGSISDCLVGRASWKNTGVVAFKAFWEKESYESWKDTAANAVWYSWLALVDKEKKAYGANSFFLRDESAARLEAMHQLVLEAE